MGAGLLANGTLARAQAGGGGSLGPGDVAILQFLAAAELIEADLWTQYAELGGIGKNPPIEVAPNQKLNNYQIALSNLDGDGPQYITSNTLDEVSHATFLNAYLESRGGEPVDFTQFETLPGSTATGSSGKLRSVPQRNQSGPRRYLSSGNHSTKCYRHSPKQQRFQRRLQPQLSR